MPGHDPSLLRAMVIKQIEYFFRCALPKVVVWLFSRAFQCFVLNLLNWSGVSFFVALVFIFFLSFWCSVDNLIKDSYLRSLMDAQGWVPASIISNFNKVRVIRFILIFLPVVYLSMCRSHYSCWHRIPVVKIYIYQIHGEMIGSIRWKRRMEDKVKVICWFRILMDQLDVNFSDQLDFRSKQINFSAFISAWKQQKTIFPQIIAIGSCVIVI